MAVPVAPGPPSVQPGHPASAVTVVIRSDLASGVPPDEVGADSRVFGRCALRLALLRRYGPDRGRELRVGRRVHLLVPDLRARRVLAEAVAALPVLRRPDRPRGKPAAAVRANVPEDALDARRAERAFVGADPRLERVGRQRLVAVFAGRPQLEHRLLLHDYFFTSMRYRSLSSG